MLIRILSTTAISALVFGVSACSGGESAPSASASQAARPTVIETAPAMTALPVSMEAASAQAPPMVTASAVAAPAAPAMDHMAHMDHSQATVAVAAAAPAPAPEVAPDETKDAAGMHPVGAITNFSLPLAKIKNFKLSDQNGKPYELYKMTDVKAIVLTMHTKGCPIGQQLLPDMKALEAKYAPKGIKFLMLNSNTYDTPAMIAEEAKSFGLDIPVLKDLPDQSTAEPLGVERSTETLVIQPGTWKILYQGPINDRVTYGRARAVATQQYVGDVVDAMLAGKPVTPSYIAPEGCILEFEHRKS